MKQLMLCFALIAIAAIIFSCNSEYHPETKRKGYFRIDFPQKEYRTFDQPGYPYTFEYPVYANVTKDSTFFGDKAEDWWINIDIPRFGGRIYISYKRVGAGGNDFDKLVNDAIKLVYKQHTEEATEIVDSVMRTPNGVEGIYYSLHGNTATANQFFLTDSTHHFLRGALYFDATPNEDSLGIVNDFLKQDLGRLINTLKWKNNK
jgi:gliding motility-associated lipoprotein GldD